jgi:hypothetical protein
VNRDVQRSQLKELLSTVLEGNHKIAYIQGMHDICSVLLLSVGARAGIWVMLALAETHLKDYVRNSLDSTMSVLQGLFPLIGKFDQDLELFFYKANVEKIFFFPILLRYCF